MGSIITPTEIAYQEAHIRYDRSVDIRVAAVV